MRSRVTWNSWPTSSSVRGRSPTRPKRSSSTRCSRSERLDSTVHSSCCCMTVAAASNGVSALRSSRKSTSSALSSPTCSKSETGSGATRWASTIFSGASPLSAAISSTVGSRPRLRDSHGDADGAALVGDGAADGLADPPRGVRGELEALAVLELLDGADQTEVAFLHEVEERQTRGLIALGDGDHESQVRLDEPLLGLAAGGHLGLEPPPLGGRRRRAALELVGRLQPRFDRLRQIDLVGGGEQLVLTDLLEILPHQVLYEVGVAATRHWFTPG